VGFDGDCNNRGDEMPNVHIENIALVLALARSIERHHLGCKIPDLIVDRVVGELSSAPSSARLALSTHFEDPRPIVHLGQIAYEIWKEGNLNIVTLSDKLISEVQSRRNLTRESSKLVRPLALPLTEFLHPNLKLAC
jgi:hypothetical protein